MKNKELIEEEFKKVWKECAKTRDNYNPLKISMRKKEPLKISDFIKLPEKKEEKKKERIRITINKY